jgi:DNA-binding MarR family transcriptional regulator
MSAPIQQTQDFYNVLHRGGTHAYAQQIGKYPLGTYWWRVGEPMRLPVQQKGAAVYVCVNPLTVRVTDEDRKNYPGQTDKYIEQRVAGKDETVECVNVLIRDYDGKDFTRGKSKAEKERIFQTNPEHYKALAFAHVRSLSPQPSVVVYSGGGYNCYWLLDKTFFIRSEADRKRIQDIQKRWVAMDPAADQSVNDLRRIFRPVGSINYKDLYAPNYPTVAFVTFNLSLTYSIEELAQLLPVAPLPVPTVGKSSPSHTQTKTQGAPYQGDSVIHKFNAAHRIEDLLDKYGYPKTGKNKRSIPGTTNRCVSVFPETNSMRSWSENDKAYHGGRKVDCFTLYRYWEHDGDMASAVKAAAAELGIEKKSPAPPPLFSARLSAIRAWVVEADFSQIIPKHLQSAKGYRTAATDKRAFDACLDIFEQYGKFDGPISKMQGSRASGLSESTFRNAIKRLEQSPLLDCITPNESIQDGAFWYALTVAYFDRVAEVSKALPTRSIYATVFSTQKAEDAWQQIGSKAQREKATIKSCGPDILLAVAVLPVGERVHQSVFGEWIHKNKSTTSRLVKKMEYFAIVSTEHIGRQQYITLLPDWQERIAQLVEFMPTYGNKNKREYGLDTRLVDRIDKKLACKVGDTVRLLDQRDKAMARITALIESDMAGLDPEIVSEKMRRLLRANSLRRNASADKKTVKTLDVGTFRINQAKAYWQVTTPSQERRTNEIMQDLDDNYNFMYGKEQLRQGAYA